MRKILLIILIPFCITCEKGDLLYNGPGSSQMPACIREIINQISKEPVWNPPAKIYSYIYRGEIVYYIPPRCCDIPSLLFDSECNIICNPDGGFTGSGDGKCSDFFKERKSEKLIWEDSRR